MTKPMSTDGKDELSRTITIEATFGSEIQRDVAMRVLRQFLSAWRENVESAHKEKKVAIRPEL